MTDSLWQAMMTFRAGRCAVGFAVAALLGAGATLPAAAQSYLSDASSGSVSVDYGVLGVAGPAGARPGVAGAGLPVGTCSCGSAPLGVIASAPQPTFSNPFGAAQVSQAPAVPPGFLTYAQAVGSSDMGSTMMSSAGQRVVLHPPSEAEPAMAAMPPSTESPTPAPTGPLPATTPTQSESSAASNATLPTTTPTQNAASMPPAMNGGSEAGTESTGSATPPAQPDQMPTSVPSPVQQQQTAEAPTTTPPATTPSTTEQATQPATSPAPGTEIQSSSTESQPASTENQPAASQPEAGTTNETATAPAAPSTDNSGQAPTTPSPDTNQTGTEQQAATTPPAPAGGAAAPAATGNGGGAALPAGAFRVLYTGESDDVPANATAELDKVAQQMQADENMRVQVMAYAAGTEDTESKARRKSLARGLAIRSYLIKAGVRSTRIDVRALGTKAEGGPADRVDVIPTS
ncbi:MAG TPA: OmpA family protein [Candidatus Cybelea sp.]|nr:OmpA family protein [Candidatus Cybelea sp.]